MIDKKLLALFIMIVFYFGCSFKKNSTELSKSDYPNDPDSLKKYCYWIWGFSLDETNPRTISGTCFFIRKNKAVYLVTAKHVLSGCSALVKDKHSPKQVYLWTANFLKDTGAKAVPINISKIQDTALCLPFEDDPDIIVLKVNESVFGKVNSVEGFIYPAFNKVKNIEIVGFPGVNNFNKQFYGYAPPSQISIPKKGLSISTHALLVETGKRDSIHYRVFSPSINYSNPYGGYSGSPVFIQDDSTKLYRIGGILVGSGKDTVNNESFLYVVKIDYALQRM